MLVAGIGLIVWTRIGAELILVLCGVVTVLVTPLVSPLQG